MKATKILTLLGVLICAGLILSCKKNSSSSNSITLNRPAYQKRWNISSVSHRPASGSSNYANLSLFKHPTIARRPQAPASYSAIEFMLNRYVVFYNDGTVSVGQYTATNDTTLALDSLGTIHIISVNANTFEFTITPLDNSAPVSIVASPAPLTIPVTNAADSVFFTSTWLLDSTIVNGNTDSALLNFDSYAIFSQYGTYLVSENDFGIQDYSTNTWLWSNTAHTAFCYGAWDGSNLVNCNGAGSVSLASYNAPYTNLVLQETDSDSTFTETVVYYLHHQ